MVGFLVSMLSRYRRAIIEEQKGFTLIEFIIVLAISSIIAFGAGTTTVQILKINGSSHNRAMAVRQAQNLGSRISQDLMMAVTANTVDDPGTTDIEFITIQRRDWETGYTYDIRYVWLDSVSLPNGVLRKETTYDETGSPVGNTTTLIADSVDSASLLQQDAMFELDIEAIAEQSSETRDYDIVQRQGW